MHITPKSAFLILQNHQDLPKKKVAFLQLTVKRVPPKEIADRLYYAHHTSINHLDRKIFEEFEDFLEEMDRMEMSLMNLTTA